MAGREAVGKVRDLVAAHGESWPAAWLRYRGLPEAAEAWREGAMREDRQ
jgi:hypothetical protein